MSAALSQSNGPVSQLFDTAFYAAQAEVPRDLGLCVEHYLREGAAAGYSPHPLFDSAAYMIDNPDVADVIADPFFHFISRGIGEGRHHSVPRATTTYLSTLTTDRLSSRRIREQARTLGWQWDAPSEWAGRVGIVSASSLGGHRSSSVSDRIVDALRDDGVVVYRLDQNAERPRTAVFDFVVAPHEFFGLGGGRSRWRDVDFARSIFLNTALPGSASYFLALSYATAPALLLDVVPQSAVLLHDSGRARSGYLPLCWRSGDAQPSSRAGGSHRFLHFITQRSRREHPHQRPIDLLFVGTLTPRRRRALAFLAPTLAKYRCSIHAPTDPHWDRALAGRGPSLQQVVRMAQQAKIVLHLHAGDIPSLDWAGTLAFSVEQGALVLTEPCLEYPGVDPGRHYLAADLEYLPSQVDELLGSREGRIRRDTVSQCAATELPAKFDLKAELRALAFLVNRGVGRCD